MLLDAGANAECQADWLVQFAQMGATFVRRRYGVDEPRVGLLFLHGFAQRLRHGESGQQGAAPAAQAAGRLVRQHDGFRQQMHAAITPMPRPEKWEGLRRRH